MKSKTERHFVVGDWYHHDTDAKCPLATCGLEDEAFAPELGEEFDEIALSELNVRKHEIISEGQAKSVWNKLISLLEARGQGEPHTYREIEEGKLELARDVQELLDWY